VSGGVLTAEQTEVAPDARTPRSRRPLLLVAACLAVAVATLAVPAALTFDAWAWLVWGRELRRLDLDTTGGPSWKPLPAIVAAPLSLFGGATPTLWLVIARAGGLLALAGAYQLARRFAGHLAGACAVLLLVLTPDGEARFGRLLLEGHTAPIEAALCVWAIERALNGRHGTALGFATALALLRPEAWPFLGLYALWTWRHVPSLRAWLCAVAAAVPLLWFGADLWGSGDPWHGADLAQVVGGDESSRLGAALERTARVVVVPVWILAGVAVVSSWRRQPRDRTLPALAAAALVWAAIVVAMCAVFGFAALSRFLLPTAAIVCLLAAIGAARVLRLAAPGPRRVASTVLVVALVVGFSWSRLGSLDTLTGDGRFRAELDRDLDLTVQRAGGPDAVLACGPVTIERAGLGNAMLPALAWKLDVPLSQVTDPTALARGTVFARAGSALEAQLAARRTAQELARSTHWVLYAHRCAGPQGQDPAGA
jgi:hypothetical protein